MRVLREWGRFRSRGVGGVRWGRIGSPVVGAAVIAGIALLAHEGAGARAQGGAGWAGVDAGGWEVALKALYILVWPILGVWIGMDAYDFTSSCGLTGPGGYRKFVIAAGAAVWLAMGLLSLPVADLAGSALAQRLGTGMSVLQSRAGVVGTLASLALLIAYGTAAGRIERWLREKELPEQLKYMGHALAILACVGIYLVVGRFVTRVLVAGGG
ncbi:MAG: hypothetical protein AB1449_08635 [Chloroflexota bacterium]